MLNSILGDVLKDPPPSLGESDALAEKIALTKRALSRLEEDKNNNSSSNKVGVSPSSPHGGVGDGIRVVPSSPVSPSTFARSPRLSICSELQPFQTRKASMSMGTDSMRGVLRSLGLLPQGVGRLNSIVAAAASRSAPELPKSSSSPSVLALQKEKTSAYRGITRRKKRWEAHVWRQGKQAYLGGYKDEEEAARAYDMAVLKIRGREAETNFPPEKYLQDLKNMEAESMTVEEFIRKLREQAKQRGKQVREEEEDKRIEALKRATSYLHHQSHQHASNPLGLGGAMTTTTTAALGSGSVSLSKLIEDEKLALLIQHFHCQKQQNNQSESEALLQLLVASQTAAPNSAKSDRSTF